MNNSNQLVAPALTIALFTAAVMSTPAQAADALTITKYANRLASGADAGVDAFNDGSDAMQTAAQVTDYASTGTALAETTAVGATIATGSGATIMHTLATAGGPVTLAGATAVSSAKLMNDALYSDCADQAACDAAQVGTYGGAAVGTAGSAVAVAVAGAGPAGLATIGSVVGGGMAAGVGVLVAAPVVAAAAVGGLAYWLFSD
ncbi:hypothetical protein [Thiospirillum jenense]|uniref:Uncharacterized protein n=1 Tax=Thiospirillum jenense TaxID=1653858 RepID=A0A839H7R8_9GAMM|nr:hypothetical protein [Thiospirillum jenense]MBB1125603.1 hypothetical protein [Thiospirillum jenense]